MTLNIRGENWTVSLDVSRLDEDDDGATFRDEKLIVVRPSASLATVRHELFHAYCSTLYIGSTEDLSLDDYEEMIAELMGEWLSDYVKQCGAVLLWLEERKRAA